MRSERYERVTAAELKFGDVVRLEGSRVDTPIDQVVRYGNIVEILPSGDTLARRQEVFRLVHANEEDVLRLALENACEAMRVPQGGTFTPSFYIDQARRELESEARNE